MWLQCNFVLENLLEFVFETLLMCWVENWFGQIFRSQYGDDRPVAPFWTRQWRTGDTECVVSKSCSWYRIVGDIFPKYYIPRAYSRDIFPWTISHPFLHSVGHFPPSTTTIRRSTIYYKSNLPIMCTKLIEVDRLGSEVRASASFKKSPLCGSVRVSTPHRCSVRVRSTG